MDLIPSGSTGSQNFGFVIDNRKCIGCHACSVACKSENEVPLGVNRTWVKYVETGRFPDNRRHFQVTRCNHCANPPCVRICPTEAMYQRADGIVEFDSAVCIGCKACLQACPYDAIYIDPESGTAAKCHYCAHRTEIGLEPACVVVCPEHAIISGDMNDPATEISRLLASTDVTVRKPEQGTAPKLFYIDGSAVAMHPTAVPRTPQTFMWADVLPLHGNGQSPHGTNGGAAEAAPRPRQSLLAGGDALLRSPETQGRPAGGPIQFGHAVAEHMVQVSYNAQHRIPWHWPVPAYLVTKGIAAGLFMFVGGGFLTGWFPFDPRVAIATAFLSLLFVAITTALLVLDLEKPERFLYILLRPQWRSWLARGALVLIGFTVVTGLWFLAESAAYNGVGQGMAETVRPFLLAAGLPLALLTAIYTAFLFAQAEGRDLWQSPLLPAHLVIQALMVGSGTVILLDLFLTLPDGMGRAALLTFLAMLAVDLFVTLSGEFGIPHASEVAARAAHEISHGHYLPHFWYGSVLAGHLVPFLLAGLVVLTGGPLWLAGVGVLAAIAGLYLYEYAFVMAPQEIPNS